MVTKHKIIVYYHTDLLDDSLISWGVQKNGKDTALASSIVWRLSCEIWDLPLLALLIKHRKITRKRMVTEHKMTC